MVSTSEQMQVPNGTGPGVRRIIDLLVLKQHASDPDHLSPQQTVFELTEIHNNLTECV